MFRSRRCCCFRLFLTAAPSCTHSLLSRIRIWGRTDGYALSPTLSAEALTCAMVTTVNKTLCTCNLLQQQIVNVLPHPRPQTAVSGGCAVISVSTSNPHAVHFKGITIVSYTLMKLKTVKNKEINQPRETRNHSWKRFAGGGGGQGGKRDDNTLKT